MTCMMSLRRVFVLLSIFSVTLILEAKDSLILKSNCICPGSTLIAECTVEGSLTDITIWSGSALYCDGNEINLIHYRYRSPGDSHGTCNNGSVEARGISAQNDHYTSQLIINVTSDMIGKIISCIHETIEPAVTVMVGTLTVATADPLPPPNTMFISNADFILREIIFSWSHAINVCPDLEIHFNILASSCGICPITTTNTNVTCTDVPTNGSVCTFAVQAVICGYIIGNESNTIELLLRLPGMQDLGCSCAKAIISAAVLAVVLFSCGVISTIIFLVMLAKLIKYKRHPFMKHQLSESNYAVVNHLQSSSGHINTEKNIAYGKVHT